MQRSAYVHGTGFIPDIIVLWIHAETKHPGGAGALRRRWSLLRKYNRGWVLRGE